MLRKLRALRGKFRTTLFFFYSNQQAAFAHKEGIYGSFKVEISNPVLGFYHLLAMLSIEVISYQMGDGAIWTFPTIFAPVMTIGGILGIINRGLYLGRLLVKIKYGQTYLSFTGAGLTGIGLHTILGRANLSVAESVFV